MRIFACISLSFKIKDRRPITSRCKLPSSGDAIKHTRSQSLPSGAPKSIAFSKVAITTRGLVTAQDLAWGIAIPSEIPVDAKA